MSFYLDHSFAMTYYNKKQSMTHYVKKQNKQANTNKLPNPRIYNRSYWPP